MVCLESYRTESSNKAGEVPCWSIWVVFTITFGLKNTVFQNQMQTLKEN